MFVENRRNTQNYVAHKTPNFELLQQVVYMATVGFKRWGSTLLLSSTLFSWMTD